MIKAPGSGMGDSLSVAAYGKAPAFCRFVLTTRASCDGAFSLIPSKAEPPSREDAKSCAFDVGPPLNVTARTIAAQAGSDELENSHGRYRHDVVMFE